MSSTTIASVVGMHFRPPAKAILQCLPAGATLILEPEPTNEYDPNAIKVLVDTASIPESQHQDLDLRASGFGFDLTTILAQPQWQIGYIARDRAEELIKYKDRFTGATLMFATDGKPLASITIE